MRRLLGLLRTEDETRSDPAERPTASETLSDRERDVVERIARGMTNAEIAAELYLGETTIKSHVARILDKLGLRDRVQIAVYAFETGLVRPGGQTPSTPR